MSRKDIANKVNSAFGRNMAAYSRGEVKPIAKDHTKKTVSDRLYKASKLEAMKEERKHVKADKHSLR